MFDQSSHAENLQRFANLLFGDMDRKWNDIQYLGQTLPEYGFSTRGQLNDANDLIGIYARIQTRYRQVQWAREKLDLEALASYISSNGDVHYHDVEKRFSLTRDEAICGLVALEYYGRLESAEFPGPLRIINSEPISK